MTRETSHETCVVILPSRVDRRVKHVLRTYVEPACAALDLHLTQSVAELESKTIAAVMEPIERSEMCIAYLGTPDRSWDSSVMMEVGYRLATGRPIVMMRERQKVAEEAEIPFDHRDHSIISLPDNREEKDNEGIKDSTVSGIVDAIQSQMDTYQKNRHIWETPHPCASVRFNLPTGDGEFYDCSPEANALFGNSSGLDGKNVAEMATELKGLMDEKQAEAFENEQFTLIGKLVTNAQLPVARRPIVFERHDSNPSYVGRAFLPIIHSYSRQGAQLLLKIIYIDVTAVARRTGDIYECQLAESPAPTAIDESARGNVVNFNEPR